MKKTLKILLPILIICIVGSVYYNLTKPTKINSFIASKIYKMPANTAFIDENFYKCVVDAYNKINETNVAYTESLTDEQLKSITSLECSGYGKTKTEKIINLNGIEKLVNITYLDLYDNDLTEIDLSGNTKLTELYIEINHLKTLNLNNAESLEYLDVSSNDLDSLIINGASSLTWIDVSFNDLVKLDVSNNSYLEYLYAYNNKLTEIDVSKNLELFELDLFKNNLTELDVSNNSKLTELEVYSNDLISLNISNATSLKNLYADHNKLTTFTTNNNIELKNLDISFNKLTLLDVSGAKYLTKLNTQFNKLTELDLSSNSNLIELNVGLNDLIYLNVSKNLELVSLYANNNELTEIDLSNNIKLTELDVEYNKLTELNLDKNLELKYLNAPTNQLKQIDLTKNVNLLELGLYENQLISLDISKNLALTILKVYTNELTELDISNNINLIELDVHYNNLSRIDLSKNIQLIDFNIYNNNLTEIDLSKNTALEKLQINGNKLESLNLSNNVKIKYLDICYNNFTSNIILYLNDKKNISNFIVKLPKVENKKSEISNLEQENIFIKDNEIFSNRAGYYEIAANYIHNFNFKWHNDYSIKYTIYVIEALSDKYDINAEEGYVYTKTDTIEETILSNISLNYGETSIEDNKLLIKYDGELIKSFDIVNISSNKYDISKNYIYMGANDLNLEDINISNSQRIVEDNKLKIKYNDNVLKEYDLVKISSEKYDLSKDYIYTGTSDLDLNNINVINGQKIVENNKLKIKYNDDLLKEYTIYNINFGEYKTYDDLLVLPEDITYEELTSNITTNGVTYKIFNGENEITEGNISEGMIIKIYYGDEVIDEYEVTNEYLEFDESLNIDNETNIIEKLPRNLKLKDFISLINTSGSIEVTNNNNELLSDDLVIGTGSKLKITLSKRTVEYTLSVRGDVTGNGQVKMADVMKIATHIIEGNVISGNAFERAADITGDGKIKMNDVMKLATFIIDGGEL